MKRLTFVVVVIGILSCSSPVPNDTGDSQKNPVITINQPPAILSLTADRDTVSIADSVRFTCRAEDPDGDSLEYEWIAVKTKEDGSVDLTYHAHFGFDTIQYMPTGKEAIWRAPRWPGGYKVFCKVMDSAYEEVAETQIIVSTANRLYFITEKCYYRINEPITNTTGNNQYPLVWVDLCYLDPYVERFENERWVYVKGGSCYWLAKSGPTGSLEYRESITWTDSTGLSEPGLYRFKNEFAIDGQSEFLNLFSNAFVVE